MRIHPISLQDLLIAEAVLAVAIILQVTVEAIGLGLFGPQYLIIATEVFLAIIIGFSAKRRHLGRGLVHRPLTLLLLGLISIANIISLAFVSRLLLSGSQHLSGPELLVSAVAIFLTNILVFALWYWEIDSPGLSGKKWSKHDHDFLFTQQDVNHTYSNWQPGLLDYIYLSVTNAINFAPADTRPLTSAAKGLMGTQALVSVFTLALVLARSVTILGQ